MAVINPPAYLNNVSTTTGQVDRLAHSTCMMPSAAGVSWMDGVRGVGDMLVTAGGGMTVNVAAGVAMVAGTQNTFQGMYVVPNDGVVNLAIAAANASLARWDLVIARVQDSQYSGTNNLATIEVVTGTAASSPSDPTVPANSLKLGRVIVPAGASSIIAGNLVDLRKWTAALGGNVPVLNQAQRDSLTKFDGLSVYRMDNHNVEVYNLATDTWVGEIASGTTGITAASGWSINSQVWTRKSNLATLYVSIKRTGAGVSAGTDGNMANIQIATLPTGLRPAQTSPGVSGATGRLCAFSFGTSGSVTLAATTPGTTIATNENVSFGGTFVLA